MKKVTRLIIQVSISHRSEKNEKNNDCINEPVESSVLLLHLLLVEMGVLHLLHLIVLHLLLLLHGPGLPMPRKAPASTSAHVSPRTILHYLNNDHNHGKLSAMNVPFIFSARTVARQYRAN